MTRELVRMVAILAPIAAIVGFLIASFVSCKSSYPADDEAANTTAAKAEARIVEMCAASVEDAGLCTPSHIRAFADLAYCANARELAVHGAAVPEAGGLACQPK